MKQHTRMLFFILFAGTLVFLSGCATTSGNANAPSELYLEIIKQKPDLARIEELVLEDPEAKTPNGQSCLYHAILIERLDVAETMAAAGARLPSGEAFALFEPYENKKTTRRYKFLQPMFPQEMVDVPAVRTTKENFYICVAGDTILRIAQKLRCSYDELIAANPDIDPKFLNVRVGQKINIPAK